MERLFDKWQDKSQWPKRLDSIEISGLRGWTGHRIEFGFPIVAIVGENGSGKSTILQAAAAIYHSPGADKKIYASSFFPDTPWEKVEGVEIKSSIYEGGNIHNISVRKPTGRWRGNQNRRKRKVYYIDLCRIQPLSARVGYSKLTKATLRVGRSRDFSEKITKRLSQIMGKTYRTIKLATVEGDPKRLIPVMQQGEQPYSGFHQAAGELTATELLAMDFEANSLVIIDEIESSLHPRAQRRLMRDLANISRINGVQFIISTHSPYVLEEIPPAGRIYIVETDEGKSTVTGVSPEFAMSKMDDEDHPECDVYVEDIASKILINEIVVSQNPELLRRLCITPYGAASVGRSLGIMVDQKRFHRPTVVFLDGDQSVAPGTALLPGNEAPEKVIFGALAECRWLNIATLLNRPSSDVIDALSRAMTTANHHDWLKEAANPLNLGKDELWRAMCISWVKNCAQTEELHEIILKIEDALNSKDRADALNNS